MAYSSTTQRVHKSANKPLQTKAWEELRREARKLEGELDVKLAAYAKLCSGYESNYGASEPDLATDQLATTKATEIENLLQRLSDVNDSMGSAISGVDGRQHTLARHRDILQEFSQEFRRLSSSLGAARDRAQLLRGSSTTPLLGVQVQSGSAKALLRERTAISSTNAAIDDVLGQARETTTNLVEQRNIFENVNSKLGTIGAKFPVVNGLLNAIRRKKSKDTIILSSVIAVCVLFTFVYIMMK